MGQRTCPTYADRYLPEMEQRVAGKPKGGGAPQGNARRRSRDTNEHRDRYEQENQTYVTDEMLVERAGGGDAGHGKVPVCW